jgi:hypothetical protein
VAKYCNQYGLATLRCIIRGEKVAKTSIKQQTTFVRQNTSQNSRSLPKKAQINEAQVKKNTKTHLSPGKGLAKNQTEAANYISEMLAVLCNMAKDVDLKFLNYLLEMAFEESIVHASKTSKIVKHQSR